MGEIYTAGRTPAWQEWSRAFRDSGAEIQGGEGSGRVVEPPDVIRHLPSCTTG